MQWVLIVYDAHIEDGRIWKGADPVLIISETALIKSSGKNGHERRSYHHTVMSSHRTKLDNYYNECVCCVDNCYSECVCYVDNFYNECVCCVDNYYNECVCCVDNCYSTCEHVCCVDSCYNECVCCVDMF